MGARAERDFREVATSDNGKLCWGDREPGTDILGEEAGGFSRLEDERGPSDRVS